MNVRTPTWHALEIYRAHYDATALAFDRHSERYGTGSMAMPQLSASASRDASGWANLTVCNVDPDNPGDVLSAA